MGGIDEEYQTGQNAQPTCEIPAAAVLGIRLRATDLEADANLIIGRILTEGGWEAIQWLRGRLPNAELTDWIERRRGAALSARQLRFWELVLGLPHRKVNAWIKDPARLLWEGRHRA